MISKRFPSFAIAPALAAKIFSSVFLFAAMVSTPATIPAQSAAPVAGAATAQPSTAVGKTLLIHYHRYDGDYEGAGVWTWDGRRTKEPPTPEVLPAGKDEFGIYFVLDRGLYGPDDSDAESIGYIVRLKGSWDHKDGTDRYWTTAQPREIWLIGNDPKIYTERPNIGPRLLAATIDAPRHLVLQLSHAIDVNTLKRDSAKLTDAKTGAAIEVISTRPIAPKDGKTFHVEVQVGKNADLFERSLTVTLNDYLPVAATLRRVLDDPKLFHTAEELGALYAPDKTTFRLFSPMAERAVTVLYDSWSGTDGRRELEMTRKGHGVWEAAANGNLEGKYYMFKVDTAKYGPGREVYDPYVKNATGQDGRGRITDLRKTDPAGFRPFSRPQFGTNRPTDAIIWEVHTRDFTSAEDSGVKAKGKFLGFIEPDTTVPGKPELTTCLAHLKELGITHVQLMPPQDYDNDETRPTYNWGYMTNNFNSPEGWYATNIRDDSRIREFKALVKGLHEAGIRVIMDVVYNHTAPPNTFEDIAPRYYHRLKTDGSFWNGSGTGNETRSEAPMARQFIRDSCRYWAEEYGIDGLRFDLMGLIDIDTLKAIREDYTRIDPSLLVYGEPWTAGANGMAKVSDKSVVRGTGLGAFNDDFRNALKGEPDGGNPGYVQNASRRGDVIKGIAGSIDSWAVNPSDSINYTDCHDNLTLWDKLKESSREPEAERLKMQALSFGLLGVSQGIMFIHGGHEFLFTKGGSHNSYNAGDQVNQLKWSQKATTAELGAYCRGIIAIRKAHPAFRLATAEEVRARLKFIDSPLPAGEAILFTLKGEGLPGESWKEIVVAVNPLGRSLEFKLPNATTSYKVYANGMKASATSPLGEAKAAISVPGRSLAILAAE